MKQLQKNILISVFIGIVIITLHYVVYLGNSNYDLGYLEGYTSAPIDLPNIKLEKEIRPTYLSPFQKLQYFYIDTKDPNNIIVEENQNFFKGNITIIKGKDIVKKYHQESGYMFISPLVSNEYPSILFFILQYTLIIIFLIFICKSYKTYLKGE